MGCGAALAHDWIIDVLTDMQAYARLNGLDALAAKLDETLAVARAEIAAASKAPAGGEAGED